MRAQLSQQDLALVRAGMPASVTPIGIDRSFAGRVWQVSPVIDPQSRQGEVRIAIPYDPAIRPGGFAEAEIARRRDHRAAAAAKRGAERREGQLRLRRQRARTRSSGAPIKIGTVDDQGVTIAEGLSRPGSGRAVGRAVPQPGQKVAPQRAGRALNRTLKLDELPQHLVLVRSATRSRRSSCSSACCWPGSSRSCGWTSTTTRTSNSRSSNVSISQPGAAPTEMENQITQKVEAAVRGVNGVDEINSSVREGN